MNQANQMFNFCCFCKQYASNDLSMACGHAFSVNNSFIKPSTLKWISCQAKLADNVSWDVCLDSLSLFGMTLCSLQEVIELFRVKLLQDKINTSFKKAPFHSEKQLNSNQLNTPF